MRRAIVSLIRRTPFELPLRALRSWYGLRHLTDDAYREARDDRAIATLMNRVLTPESTCVDIGANLGRILRMMVDRAPRGRHIAVEAIPELAASLRARFPGVEVHECAAGDETGTTIFHHITNMQGWSGLRPPASAWHTAQGVVLQQEALTLQIRRMDELIPSDCSVRLMKIDVEGAEAAVLRGALTTIRRCRPYLIVEFGETHSQSFGVTPDEMFSLLTIDCGLTVRTLSTQRRLDRKAFVQICRHATLTNYDRASQGNFLATPE